MKINEIKNEITGKNFAVVNYYVNRVRNAVANEYARRHGLLHSVDNPEGLTELAPDMNTGGTLDTPRYFRVLSDGRVHELEDFQYSYIHGPHDYGVVKHHEWRTLPLNFMVDAGRVAREIITGERSRFYMNRNLIPEIMEITRNISI